MIDELIAGGWINTWKDGHVHGDPLIGHQEDWQTNYILDETVAPMRALQKVIVGDRGHCVLLFDSLDRVDDLGRLENSLRDDMVALKKAGIGAVVVGPMRLSYEHRPSIANLFDQNIHPLAEIEPVEHGLVFLVEVLSRRASPGIMPRESCLELARVSGGVLRDLITLAKSAAQEAYGLGSDRVELEHIARAAEQFGRVRAVGLDGEQVEVLKKIRESGTLVIRGERELALLESRRVLDYGGGRFVVEGDRMLAERARQQRLEGLREQFGISDEEFLARVKNGKLSLEPEHAEWLVLLCRDDLLMDEADKP